MANPIIQSKPTNVGAPVQQGSPQRFKSSLEILREGLLNDLEDPALVDQTISSLAQLAQAGLTRFVQIGNTVFVVSQFNSQRQMLPQGEAEIHVYTVESLPEMAKRFAVVANTLRQMGYRKVYTYVLEPAIFRVLKSAEAQAKVQTNVKQQMMYLGGEMQPAYLIEVIL